MPDQPARSTARSAPGDATATPGRPHAGSGDSALRKAVKALVAQWHTSGFYDRQDPALALALHEALDA